MIYLDTSVLIPFLYEETIRPERFASTRRLVEAIRSGRVQAVISLYALPELYAYLARQYSDSRFNTTFRLSLIELFQIPFVIAPHLSRTDLELWRRRVKISDATDLPHVASALANGCNCIITFDEHFQQSVGLIAAYDPTQFLASLEQK